jgi:hypothetical protein
MDKSFSMDKCSSSTCRHENHGIRQLLLRISAKPLAGRIEVSYLPFIVKGLLIASAATGIKKAIDAAKDSYEAVKLNCRA